MRYQFRIPPDAKGPLDITARVNYRHLRQSYLNNVFGPGAFPGEDHTYAMSEEELALAARRREADPRGGHQDGGTGAHESGRVRFDGLVLTFEATPPSTWMDWIDNELAAECGSVPARYSW